MKLLQKDFIIDTSPITISSDLNLGHIYSYCQLDIIARYKRQLGYNVFFPIGFDCNGLQTEKLLEKHKEGLLCNQVHKDDIIEGYIFKNLALFRKLNISFERLSCGCYDFYSTMDKTELAHKIFNKLKEQNLIYEEETSIYWDPQYNTALSRSEIEEKDNKLYNKRSGKEIIIKKSKQWFVKQVEFKDNLLKLIEPIEFYPINQKDILIKWIQNLNQDWCISRNRNFGVKIPDGTERVFTSWFISALTPYYFYTDKQEDTIRFQCKDSIKMYYFSILMSFLLYNKLPFKKVLFSGLRINKTKGTIKSKVNAINHIINQIKYPKSDVSDIIRYCSGCYPLGQNIIYNKQKFNDANKLINRLKNAVNYVILYNGRHNYKFEKNQQNVIFDKIISEYKKYFDNFDYTTSLKIIEEYFYSGFCKELIKNSKKGFDKNDAFDLNEQIVEILKALYPFLPNTCEELLSKVN